MPIATQADVAAAIQVAFDTSPDPRVTANIVQAQALLEAEVGIPFDAPASPVVVKLTGNGTDQVDVPRWPITTMVSVVEGGVTLVDETDFWWDTSGTLYRNGVWSQHRHDIVVTYTPGWPDPDSAPQRFRQLVASVAGRMWKASVAWAEAEGAAGIKQETIGAYSVTYQDSDDDNTLLPHEERAARRLRRKVGSRRVY